MAHAVIMPKAGMAMETGTVVEWRKSVGDTVEKGEVLLEIETDKVTMDVEAEQAGTLIAILREPGDVVPVTETIGYIGAAGEQVPEIAVGRADRADETVRRDATGSGGADDNSSGSTKLGGGAYGAEQAHARTTPATPAARRRADELEVDVRKVGGSGPYGAVTVRDIEEYAPETVSVSPVARRFAEALGVDLGAVAGTGPGGRVVKKDVVAAAADSAAGSASHGGDRRRAGTRPINEMRRRIAAQMTRSHAEIPAVTLEAKADVTELLSLRRSVNDNAAGKISLNDFLLKAVALCLPSHPTLRARYENETLSVMDGSAIGFAVALDDGLIVPVVRDVGRLTVSAISTETKRLTEAARGETLKPDDVRGGVFTVTNLGMYGVTHFTPIINPPETAILGICAAEETVKLLGGVPTARSVLPLCLTIDHRVLDGAVGALFLSDLVRVLETPLRILM